MKSSWQAISQEVSYVCDGEIWLINKYAYGVFTNQQFEWSDIGMGWNQNKNRNQNKLFTLLWELESE